MKIWVINSSEGVTAWTSEKLARVALRRQMIAHQESYLESTLEGLPLQRAWLEWFEDTSKARPPRSIWESRALEQNPLWLMHPATMEEFRFSLRARIASEEQRIAEYRDRIERLQAGHDFSEEWGYQIVEWELDTDELQAHAVYD